MFIKGAWIEDPDKLPNHIFHKYFCCAFYGVITDLDKKAYCCALNGKVLREFDDKPSAPIRIPDWCPKAQNNKGGL